VSSVYISVGDNPISNRLSLAPASFFLPHMQPPALRLTNDLRFISGLSRLNVTLGARNDRLGHCRLEL